MGFKNYTTLDESEKLVCAGVNPHSSDLVYPYREDGFYDVPSYRCGLGEECDGLPCWSTDALDALLPDDIEHNFSKYRKCVVSERGGGWSVEYVCVGNCPMGVLDRTVSTAIHTHLIDAFLEAVLALCAKGIMLRYESAGKDYEKPRVLADGYTKAYGECDCLRFPRFYTSHDEADRLVSLGVDPETADMYYPLSESLSREPLARRWGDLSDVVKGFAKPCWSLGAIIAQMKPNEYEAYAVHGQLNGASRVSFGEHVILKGDLFDAAYEMLCWMLENGVQGVGESVTKKLLADNGFRLSSDGSRNEVYSFKEDFQDRVEWIDMKVCGDGLWTLTAQVYSKDRDSVRSVKIEKERIGLKRFNSVLREIGLTKEIEAGQVCV